jgi:3-oxoacyl-[acyl-carrier protein] reductase
MTNLANKIALVTGSSKGIGAAIAKSLAAAGATVVVNYASGKSGAERTVDDIIKGGGKATALQGNVSKPDDIVRVYEQIRDLHQRLDILVNSAGVYAVGTLEDVTPDEFHRQFNLNVLGLLLSTREALRLFGPHGGSVINIGSVVGTMSPASASIYSATKGAVNAITVSLSKELGGRNIRVNALNPGLVETEGSVSAGFVGGDFLKTILATTPLGRIGQPDDIARIAVFLASDESAWISGQLINASGGQTM